MSNSRQWLAVASIVVFAAVGLGIVTKRSGSQITLIEIGTRAPQFRGKFIAGGGQDAAPGDPSTRSLANYQGQVVLLNVWATWCGPCRTEMPSIQELYSEFGPSGLRVVAISVDNPGMEKPIAAFARELKLTFDILHDPEKQIEAAYITSGVPETFVIGRDGIVRKRVSGSTDWATNGQKALVRQLLAERAP